jgi:hypothetical protein
LLRRRSGVPIERAMKFPSTSLPWAQVIYWIGAVATLLTAQACAEPAGHTGDSIKVLHFADCQLGAAADCTPGRNGNPGTPDAPKRDLDGVNLNALPAGSKLLFRRGGAWTFSITLDNPEARPDVPLIFDAYGSGVAPVLRTPAGNAVNFGRWNNTSHDGGYTFRNLVFDGGGKAQWGLFLVQNVRNITIENVTITGFELAIHASSGLPHGVNNVVLRNSKILRNSSMGFLGKLNDSVFEGNVFEGNNFRGTALEHAIYLAGGRNNVIRNNRFVRNSVVDGQCTGGNVTVHGQIDGLRIEHNVIEQDAATASCLGFSIIPGYAGRSEAFRGVVVRGNTVVNVGTCSVCVRSAPGIVIEHNLFINRQAPAHRGVMLPIGRSSSEDADDVQPVVRNNVACYTGSDSRSVAVAVAARGAVVEDNRLITGAAASEPPCAPPPRQPGPSRS